MTNLTRIFWLKTILLLLVNVRADRSQKDCQMWLVRRNLQRARYWNCKKDCRPARCECRSRSDVSECGTYRNPYSGLSSISPVINKSPSPPPIRNSNQPPVSSSGFGFPSSSTGEITSNGMGVSTAFQSHIQGAPPSASPLLPPALTDARDQPRQPLFADPTQVAPEEWHHQQLTGAMPPSQRPEQVPPATLDSNWPSLQTTLQSASETPVASNSWDFSQDSASSLSPSQLPPGTSLANNRNGWSVSDPPSSFTPEPSEDGNNEGWAANINGGQRDQQSYRQIYQSLSPSPPKAPSARSYGASSRQSLPFSQSLPQQSDSRFPSALKAIDALSVNCVDNNCAGFAAPKPVIEPESRRLEQPQPHQQQPKTTRNSTRKNHQPYLFAYISHPPGYGPAEMMQAKTERMGMYQPIANLSDVDFRKNGFESGDAPPPAPDITLLPPNFRIYRNV